MAGEEKSAWGRTKLTESHFLEDGEERVEEEEVWIGEKEPAVSGRCGHKKRKLTRNLLAPNEAPKKRSISYKADPCPLIRNLLQKITAQLQNAIFPHYRV